MAGHSKWANIQHMRLAISKAKAVNMPNDRIKKAIDTGAGNNDTADYEEVRYEGYGPGGVAVVVDALTPNMAKRKKQNLCGIPTP